MSSLDKLSRHPAVARVEAGRCCKFAVYLREGFTFAGGENWAETRGYAHFLTLAPCKLSPAPDGWGVFALTAPGVYTLQQVTHIEREDAERAASRFIRGCDAHVRPLYAGERS